MAIVTLGIDPGVKGAMVCYSPETKTIVGVWDMPTIMETVGKTRKPRLLLPELLRILKELISMPLTIELAALEEVGGLPKQSAVSAFTFGWTTGCTYTALVANRIPVDRVRPTVWKKVMRCGKTDADIARRVIELFPNEPEHYWVGPKGGLKDGRCEAAMLALFAANYSLGRRN